MDSRPRLYLCTAFLCGVLLTLGFKDFYPDLERRFRRRRVPINSIAGAGLTSKDQIDLEDHTKNIKEADIHDVEIGDGIEACVGNTPLFKIKSLSEETGCDILGKAEVDLGDLEYAELNRISDLWLVPQWSWRKSQGSRGFEYDQDGTYMLPMSQNPISQSLLSIHIGRRTRPIETPLW